MSETQTFENHVRRLPAQYTAMALIVIANILWSAYRLTSGVSVDAVMAFLVSLALFIMALSARTQTLTVQNRVIRLEMKLRLCELLPPDVAARACKLGIPQLTALRFASDEELPGLVQEVLGGQLTDPKAIKRRVANWQGDFLRA